jgi:hypothetical protein
MAAQRELQPAAHARARDRGNDRLAARFDRSNDGRERRLGRRLRRVEFADVGAAREQLAGADQHDRGNRRIGIRSFDSRPRRRCASPGRAR